MIHLRHAKLECDIALEAGDIANLVIENPSFYRQFVMELLNDDTETFSFYENKKDLTFDKHAIIVPNLFDINPNSKKILTAIYKKIEKSAITVERREKLEQINQKISALLAEIADDFDGTISYNDQITMPQLLGQLDFKFDYDDTNFLTQLVSYVRAWREAKDVRIIIVLNIQSMLTDEEIAMFAEECKYMGIPIINIAYFDKVIPSSKRIVIDKDLCEIY